MREFFNNRREMKRKIAEQVQSDKIKDREEKKQINKLAEKEKTTALAKRKEMKKAKKQVWKSELKSLDRKERRRAKKEAKMYHKIKRRPIRLAIWSVVTALIVIVVILVGPTVSNLIGMISGKDITVNSETPEAKAALEYGETISEEIANEGIVLLKNDADHLPLQEKSVNVFGVSALDFRFGGGGSGTSDTSRALDLFEGLENAGIDYNTKLHDKYVEIGRDLGLKDDDDVGIIQVIKGMMGSNITDEPEIDHLSDDMLEQAKKFSNNALIVINSAASEASDMEIEELRLTENKRALIDRVAAYFDNVTIIVNAGNAMELGFVEEYDSIKSVVLVGTPGPYGAKALGNVLAGIVNPSGRLVDTYVYDNTTAPGSENFGDYSYENVKYSFINYEESIYVGYRFYETYFLDYEAGYKETVLYPYGYGLSYTDFDWEVTDTSFTDDEIEVKVAVTNTGEVVGKDVVQLYYSPPYIEGGLEKSAIELGAFAKTDELAPGETEVLNLNFEVEEMTSYDMHDEEAFVLDAGTYDVKVARNVHEVVEEFSFEVAEKVVFSKDSVTGTPYENRFDLAKGEIEYLSRDEWESTYPSDENINYEAPDYVVDAIAGKDDVKEERDVPNFNVDNGLKLKDMVGLAMNDPKWDDFLDQFTLDEMIEYVTNGAYKTIEIERLGIPQTLLMDGPAGFSYFFREVKAAAYPTEVVVASTWNDELAYEMGAAVGKEARAYGIQGWYAPAMNIHRTAQGGRNFEYFSEDPLLSGKISAAITRGAQDQGIIIFMN